TVNSNVSNRFLVTNSNLSFPSADDLEKTASDVTVTCVDTYGNPTTTAAAVSLAPVNISDGQTYGTNLGTFKLATSDGGGAVDITGLSLDFSAITAITLF